MIRFVLALLLVQAFYCAEFPDLKNHIKLTWNQVSLDQKFDASQTVSDEDGNVNNFILCAAFNNDADNVTCFYDHAFAEWTSGGLNFSATGSGNFTTKVVSKVNESYTCLEFYNPVCGFEKDGGFKKIYKETLVDSGSWEVSYSCSKSVVPDDKDYTWLIIVGTIVGILVIVGAVLGVMYLKKKKAGKEGQMTDGRDGLLQNA